MKVRTATANDAEGLIAMAKVMHQESRFVGYALQEDQLHKVIQETLSEPKWRCLFVAESSHGGLVGMLGGYVLPLFFSSSGFVAQDQFFFVKPEQRGSSAAVKLLMAFERWANNRQALEVNINMSVGIDMERFDRFMAHVGYRSCGKNFFKSLKIRTGQHVAG